VREGWLIPKEGITAGDPVGVMCQVRRGWGRKSRKTTVLGSQGTTEGEHLVRFKGSKRLLSR